MVREADVIVLTSADPPRAREGVPVALMEGMACGLPVVASGISGIPELVDDGRTGFLTPPREPRAVADALERLARDPELRHRLGTAGREKVQARVRPASERRPVDPDVPHARRDGEACVMRGNGVWFGFGGQSLEFRVQDFLVGWVSPLQ